MVELVYKMPRRANNERKPAAETTLRKTTEWRTSPSAQGPQRAPPHSARSTQGGLRLLINQRAQAMSTLNVLSKS